MVFPITLVSFSFLFSLRSNTSLIIVLKHFQQRATPLWTYCPGAFEQLSHFMNSSFRLILQRFFFFGLFPELLRHVFGKNHEKMDGLGMDNCVDRTDRNRLFFLPDQSHSKLWIFRSDK
jgi:hypothetical protein